MDCFQIQKSVSIFSTSPSSIQIIEAQDKGGVSLAPKIKRLSEYLGQSYYREYLSGLEDLVILMDEAHRYHADASKNAINELKPILGIELTATPI
ncbi:MAG: DEAD/DEAH box helicase family protein [Saprospiraceae bacterium]